MNKKYLPWIAAVIIVLAALAYVQWKNLSNQSNPPATPANNSAGNENTGTSSPLSGEQNGNEMTGILKNSDDAARGNLMIEIDGKNIYLNTSRDFSELIDKEVVVTIKGDIHSFSLVDIKEKSN